MKRASHFAVSIVMLLGTSAPADAGVWPELGNSQTRSDIEVAAAYGLIDNITMGGPQPWTGFLGKLQDESRETALPDYIRDGLQRLRKQGMADLDLHHPHLSVDLDFASDPAVVRGYDALGRSRYQGQVTYEYLATSTAVHLSVGARNKSGTDSQTLMFDESYIAQRLDNVVVYAGYRSHWWGPGWISALSLSNNARPIPQIGFSRIDTDASEHWLLNWLGPWQFETFVGVLDGPRVARNTVYMAMRFAFNPLPGLELAIARHTEMCGTGHPCKPLAEYFDFNNDPKHTNKTNEEATVDIKYTGVAFSHPYSLYAQFMNEDTNPIIHSGTSRVYGGTVWFPLEGLTGRLTLEYANSIATNNIFWGGAEHGFAYNNWSYDDGMRYRGRTLGFSLDSDSILYSAQASAIDQQGRTFTLTYHRALVSNPLNEKGNVVTSAPVRFHAVEFRAGIPLKWGEYKATADAAARWESDTPRPAQGSRAEFELALRLAL